MKHNIFFHTEETQYVVKNKNNIRKWLTQAFSIEGFTIDCLNIIICSDEYLLKINREHLNHDYYTDIITFQYSDNQNVTGDLFISIDTVKHNAKKHNSLLKDELERVIVHGSLHLMGYKDKTPTEQEEMRGKEDYYLSLRTF